MKVDKRLILTAASCAGTVITAVLAARGGAKCDRILQNMPADASTFDKVKAGAPVYIWAAAAGAATIACNIASHQVGTAIIASGAATIATLSSKLGGARMSAKEYMDKAKEVLGKEKEMEIRKELAKPAIHPSIGKDGEVLRTFKIDWLGHTVNPICFEASMATVLEAMMLLNQFIFDPTAQYTRGGAWGASVSDFLVAVQHPELCTDKTDKAGWYAPILAAECDAYWLGSAIEPNDDGSYTIFLDWYPSLDIESYVEMCEREGII